MVLGKVTFLQAVTELPRLLPELPLAPPCSRVETSHISGDSEMLFVPQNTKKNTFLWVISGFRKEETQWSLFKKSSFQIALDAAIPPTDIDISLLASLL